MVIENIFVEISAIVTIFGWSFFSFWSAIPAGIALDVSPLWVMFTVTVSYGCGALLVMLAGTPLRERVRRRMGQKGVSESPNRMVLTVQNAWNRFGLIGLSILAPMTVGAQVGAVIGLSFGESPLRLVVGLTLGAALWSILITLAVLAGVVAVT